MSGMSDVLAALRNVVLMQERIAVLQKQVEQIAGDVSGLNAYCGGLDKRLVRIETMIEMSLRSAPPRIEG